jgi:hypothetical protein
MPTRKEMYEEIEETLSAFKIRLEENKRNNKPFWSDVEFEEGGLQIMCEGLETFLNPYFSKPKELQKYLSANFVKEQIDEIYRVVVDDKEGFVPTPYPTYKELIEKVEPPEFIDTASYILTLTVHAEKFLTQNNELDDKTKKKTSELINRSLTWLIDNHIPNEGWSGICKKTVTHIYPTWSTMSALPEIEILKSAASQETSELIKKFENVVSATRNYLTEFAKDQGEELWKGHSKTRDRAIIYCVYGLETLIYLGVQKDNPELILNLTKTILSGWNENTDWFLEPETHYFYATEKERIGYEDSSILALSIKTLSKVGNSFGKNEISQVEISGITLDKVLETTLEKMFAILNEKFYQKEKGLWTDTSGRFSIYMTERVIEAMLVYAEFLGAPEPTLTEINEKIDGLIDMVSKIDQDIVIDRLSATNEKVESLEGILEEVKDTLGNLSARFATYFGQSHSEETVPSDMKSKNIRRKT